MCSRGGASPEQHLQPPQLSSFSSSSSWPCRFPEPQVRLCPSPGPTPVRHRKKTLMRNPVKQCIMGVHYVMRFKNGPEARPGKRRQLLAPRNSPTLHTGRSSPTLGRQNRRLYAHTHTQVFNIKLYKYLAFITHYYFYDHDYTHLVQTTHRPQGLDTPTGAQEPPAPQHLHTGGGGCLYHSVMECNTISVHQGRCSTRSLIHTTQRSTRHHPT